MDNNKATYLFVSEASALLGSNGGDSDKRERCLREKGIEPFGYLKGRSEGKEFMRPFYLESEVIAKANELNRGKVPETRDDDLRKQVSDLSTKFDQLIEKLGGLS